MTNHPNRSQRATFTDNGDHVTLRYTDDYDDEVRTREFWIPNVSGNAHVREGDRQVCYQPSYYGNTLTVGQKERLIDVIRTEYRAMRAAERADRYSF